MMANMQAWRVATATCPNCVSADSSRKSACLSCGGTGDMLATLLLDAYRRGERNVLDRLAEVELARKVAIETLQEQRPDAARVRSMMGL